MDQDQAVAGGFPPPDALAPLLLPLPLSLPLLLALLLALRLSARPGVSLRWRRSVELADGAELLSAMLAVKAAASARLGTVRVPPAPVDGGTAAPVPIPLMVLLQLLLPLTVAAAKDSVMLAKGHKFVVCTSPRSRWKHSRTAAPTELRRATIALTTLHLFNRGS